MKNKLMIVAMFVAALALPAASFAATYGYVNTNGQLATVNANSAEQALVLPVDIAAHSGVILLSGNTLQMSMPLVATSTSMAMPMASSSMMASTSMVMASTTATSSMASSSSMMASSTATSTATSTMK